MRHRLPLLVSAVVMVGSGASEAGVYPCTEAGLDSAIADGGGPHFFSCGGPATVATSGEKLLATDVILDGEHDLTVDAGGAHRVFRVNAGVTATLERMTIAGGSVSGSGGGVLNEGTLTLVESTVRDNEAEVGGGIANGDDLTVLRCTVDGNTAQEIALASGGGIANLAGATASIEESTISRNTGSAGFVLGGGIVNSGTLALKNSTISGNEAAATNLGEGGAIHNTTGAGLTLNHVTISDNVATGAANGAALFQDATLTISNSLIDGDCGGSGTTNSEGGNLESPGDTCGLAPPDDQVNVSSFDLALGPLADAGGPTETHSLIGLGAPVDAAELDSCEPTDQRGQPRPVGLGCDVGAYESTLADGPYLHPCDEAGLDTAIAAGGGVHVFDCTGPTTIFTSGEKVLTQDAILDGEGNVILDAGGAHRVFRVAFDVQAEIRGMTFQNGTGAETCPTFIVGSCGGGLENDGTLRLLDCTVRDSHAEGGGGVYNDGQLSVDRCTFDGNTARLGGGGIFNGFTAEAVIRESTLSRNRADGPGFVKAIRGGGVANDAGVLAIVNSTLSGNEIVSESFGTGAALHTSGSVDLSHVTSSNNTVTAVEGPMHSVSLEGAAAVLTIANSVVDGDCGVIAGSSPPISLGGNVESPGSTCNLTGPGDENGVAAAALGLGPLQDNGGSTETHDLLADSVAIENGVLAACPPNDQRGHPRPDPILTSCDSGAVEVALPEPDVAVQLAAGILALLALRRLGRGSDRTRRIPSPGGRIEHWPR